MEYKYLNNIVYPSDLKQLPVEALPEVCAEVRDFIIRACSQNPGHLGSSLGTIELTVALHYVYDTPNDRLVWDVGHQAYAHKILTGRRERFHTNRQFKGISPFPKPDESEYDAFIAGHASNSISAALGEAIAADKIAALQGKQAKRVVAIIGDGAMTGGLAFEGLNNAAMQDNNLLIILNDNNMAIDPIRGGFTQYLVDLTTSAGYNWLRWNVYRVARKLHLINDKKKQKLQRFTNNLKTTLTHQPKNIFSSMNLRYFGPADGHNVLDLVRILSEIKDYKGARVLHIVTQKGKGYAPAEENPTIWHAPGEFNVETGQRKAQAPQPPKGGAEKHGQIIPPVGGTGGGLPLWQEVFGETLLELARENKRIVGITPAMPSGCSMNIMQAEMPERVFDVGIAEGHAVTFSAGLASEGLLPYCNIYSSFLQRSYDNIIHDVAIPKLPVVLCIDRAGIVGNDGATHHGLLDLAFLRPVPNMIIGAPMTADDLRQMLYTAQFANAPIAIRYPRGRAAAYNCEPFKQMEIGKGVCLKTLDEGQRTKDKKNVAVLSLGAIGETVREAVKDLSVAHYDMRWLKPLDTNILEEVIQHYDTVVTVEDGVIAGGLSSAVAEYLASHTPNAKPHITHHALGINDQFVEHGSTKELYHMLELDKDGIYTKIKTLCE